MCDITSFLDTNNILLEIIKSIQYSRIDAGGTDGQLRHHVDMQGHLITSIIESSVSSQGFIQKFYLGGGATPLLPEGVGGYTPLVSCING